MHVQGLSQTPNCFTHVQLNTKACYKYGSLDLLGPEKIIIDMI